MNLQFIEEGHKYIVDGEEVPSVSEIIRFISREVYGDIDEETLQYAAERGTAVHKACEELDKTGTVECDEEIIGYVQAYKKFLEEHEVEWELIEQSLYDEWLYFAGTIDRYGTIDGEKAILDIKSSAIIKKLLVKAQLDGYYHLACDNNYIPQKAYCLQLKKNGGYRLYEVGIKGDVFRDCLKLHEALLRKQPRGGIE